FYRRTRLSDRSNPNHWLMKLIPFAATLALLFGVSSISPAAENVADKIKQANEAIDKNDFDRAVELFSQLISANNRNAEMYNGRGIARVGLNDDKQALSDFNEAIRLKPKYAEAYARRSGVFQRLNQPDKALADANKAIQLDSQYPFAYVKR